MVLDDSFADCVSKGFHVGFVILSEWTMEETVVVGVSALFGAHFCTFQADIFAVGLWNLVLVGVSLFEYECTEVEVALVLAFSIASSSRNSASSPALNSDAWKGDN